MSDAQTPTIDADAYDVLARYSAPVKRAERKILGREKQIQAIMAAFSRPELCNVILLAPAGSGKTALVQATMLVDSERIYLDVDVSKMIAEHGADTLGAKLKVLFDQTRDYVEDTGREIVLFIDEFHKIINVSESAVEDLKPLLADSGTRGIRVLAATTLEEFNKYISANQPLVERLQRINVPEPDEELTVAILKGMAERYGVADEFYNDHIFHRIYEYTNRYIPANSQPRKSILVLDAMVGWHRFAHRRMDERLLADVIMESEDVNVAFRVDASKVKAALDSKVLDQGYASMQIARRLQLCVADLNDKTKPMSTFLFTGSTGVGKGHPVGTLIPTLEDGSAPGRTQVEDIRPGDHVFAPDGSPVEVLGVFPRGKMQVYRVEFSDGRSVVVDKDHLWGVYLHKHDRDDDNLTVIATHRIASMLESSTSAEARLSIPMNQPVQWPEREFPVDPYALGVFITDGRLDKNRSLLAIANSNEFIVKKCAERIGAAGYERFYNTYVESRYGRSETKEWRFLTGETFDNGRAKLVRKDDVLGMLPGICSEKRRIPESYLRACVEQRWELVRGLFDAGGTIPAKGNCRFDVSYSTFCEGLADDVRELLLSLGVSSTLSTCERHDTWANHDGKRFCFNYRTEYTVHVRCAHADKERFFSLPRKREIARKAAVEASKQTYDTEFVDIVSAVPLPDEVETVCLYVDHPDHLYQCDGFVVTHNTEMTKQLANILFGDSRRLIRFDMTEYANADTLERFRDLLTTRVWEHPYSIILLDEIEKACAEVTRLLLQVLDDGRLTNRNNREVSFTNAYVVLTTNAGSEIYQTVAQYATGDGDSELNRLADEMRQMEGEMDAHAGLVEGRPRSEEEAKADEEWVERYDKLIRRSISQTQGANRFPPELLGRIDMIVPFKPLSRSTMRAIVRMRLQRLQREVLAKHNIQVGIDYDNVVRYLVDDRLDTDSNSGGARIVLSVLERDVTTAIARQINECPPVSGRLYVSVDDPNLMAISSKTRLKSEAHIVVAEPYGRR